MSLTVLSHTCYCSLHNFSFYCSPHHRDLHSFPTRRSSDLIAALCQYFCPQCSCTLPITSANLDERYIGERFGDARRKLRVDRKSTRLNSSHRTISYAVFCLKKKKKKHHNISIYDKL